MPKLTRSQLSLLKKLKKKGLHPEQVKQLENNFNEFGVEGITNPKSLEKARISIEKAGAQKQEGRTRKFIKSTARKFGDFLENVDESITGWFDKYADQFENAVKTAPAVMAGIGGAALGIPGGPLTMAAGGATGFGAMNELVRKIDPDFARKQPEAVKKIARTLAVLGGSGLALDKAKKIITSAGGPAKFVEQTNEDIQNQPELLAAIEGPQENQQSSSMIPNYMRNPEGSVLNKPSNLLSNFLKNPDQEILTPRYGQPQAQEGRFPRAKNFASNVYNAVNPQVNPNDPSSQRGLSPLDMAIIGGAGAKEGWDYLRGNKPAEPTFQQIPGEDTSTIAYRQKIRDMAIPELERMIEYNKRSSMYKLLNSLNPYGEQA